MSEHLAAPDLTDAVHDAIMLQALSEALVTVHDGTKHSATMVVALSEVVAEKAKALAAALEVLNDVKATKDLSSTTNQRNMENSN